MSWSRTVEESRGWNPTWTRGSLDSQLFMLCIGAGTGIPTEPFSLRDFVVMGTLRDSYGWIHGSACAAVSLKHTSGTRSVKPKGDLVHFSLHGTGFPKPCWAGGGGLSTASPRRLVGISTTTPPVSVSGDSSRGPMHQFQSEAGT